MKKITPTITFSSLQSVVKKNIPATLKKVYTSFFMYSFYKPENISHNDNKLGIWSNVKGYGITLLFVTLFLQPAAYSQQILGSFPAMDGGFESQSGTLATLATPIVAAQTAYTRNNSSVSGTINTTGGRSSAKFLSITTGSTGQGFYTPTANLASNTSYVVQYYFKYSGSSGRKFTQGATSNGGNNWGSASGNPNVNSISIWTKEVEVINSNTQAATAYGLIRSMSGGGGISTAFDIDDYVVYAGSAADVTAPNEVTSPIATYSSPNLNISWTAPAGGVDGGGYVVVRYTTDPSTEPAPNANGIYVKSNTIGNGVVAYIGTGTSFSDPGLTVNTLYYYRVYTVDKAFNYSPSPVVFTGMTTAATTPAVSITIPGIPAASIERNSVTDIIYSFSLTATTYYTTLTQLTFQNTAGTYTSADFANFKLYSSTINIFPGGTPLATINAPTNTSPQTFTGFSKVIPPSPAAIYFWITTDVKALAAINNSITVTPDISGSNLTFSGAPPVVSTGSATVSGAQTIVAPASYTWIGGAAGDWTVATNWSPTRSTPKASDDITFSTAGTVTVSNVPTQTVSSLLISGNGKIILTSAVASTLTVLNISGLLAADLSINSGCSLTLGTFANLSLGTGTTADISGVLNVNSGSIYNTDAANAVTIVNNATYPLAVDGIINNAGTVTSTNIARLIVKNGAVYNHNIDGGLIPTATWNFNSACLISGIVNQQSFSSGPKQTFSKFIWDCPAQNQTHFILGQNTTNASPCVITDSFIIKRTNGKILQITSSGGQNDFTCGNYFQYGGTVAITYNTDAGGVQRSLTVNNTMYVADTLESDAKFQIINNPGGTNNITGRLFVKGNIDMHKVLNTTTLDAFKSTPLNPSIAEMWFTGNADQYVKFSTITDSINFVTAQTSAGTNVLLQSDAKARQLRLSLGTLNIGSNTLTVNREVSYPSPGTGLIAGTAASSLIMTMNGGNAGVLNFSPYNAVLKNLTQLANNFVSLGTATPLSIAAGTASSPGRDSLGTGATLTTNDNLRLLSDINGTARIAKIPVDGTGNALATIIGKVTVERYLPMNFSSDARRWRLLTAPFKFTNSPTINMAWQEGVSNPDRLNPALYDPKPGYGTHITKSTAWTSDGYDQGSTNNPSIYYYLNGTWTAPANTNAVKITDNSGCYMLFARGDRSIIVSTTTINASPTTLEPKGELNTGDVTVPLIASGYQTIGNPYASEIKLDNIAFNDTLGNKKTIYLWDPKTLGSFNVGKFITCSGDGGSPATYTYTGNTSAYNTRPGVIESSSAFIVKGNGGNIVFHESDKTIESSTVGISSRPSAARNSFGTIRKLYTDLFVMKAEGAVLADGVANAYNTNYKNSIEYFDAPKLTSFTSKEELSIRREGQLFAIERRKKVNNFDTIFLNISKLNPTDYLFAFRPVDFNNNYTAFLEDKFLGTIKQISLTQRSTVSFSITADPASAVSDRFHIIFRKPSARKSINLTAGLHSADIALEWVNNRDDEEDDAEQNWVERSADGIHFTTVASNEPGRNAAARIDHQWLDENPVPGDYWYRIRFINEENKPAYSNIVKVVKAATMELPAIRPNPVTNGQVNLYMGQLPEGTYSIRISNRIRQVIYTGTINHHNGNTVEVINLDKNNNKGLYSVEINAGNKNITTLNMMVE